jgi:hypothetical protein
MLSTPARKSGEPRPQASCSKRPVLPWLKEVTRAPLTLPSISIFIRAISFSLSQTRCCTAALSSNPKLQCGSTCPSSPSRWLPVAKGGAIPHRLSRGLRPCAALLTLNPPHPPHRQTIPLRRHRICTLLSPTTRTRCCTQESLCYWG